MEQIVVQTEVQPDGNILLFYVDENHDIDPSILEEVEDESIEAQPDTKYIIEDAGGDSEDELDIAQATETVQQEQWPDHEITRLIIFYTDNKKTFLNGTTKSKHLWAVACKTMLTERNPISCEIKFRMLKNKYIHACIEKQKNSNYHWPFYNLCYQAFYDDPDVLSCISEMSQVQEEDTKPVTHIVNQGGVIVVKKLVQQQCDEAIEAMLKSYIKHKSMHNNAYISKHAWDTIALEIGKEDGNYWQKRFYNFKKHYVTMLHRQKEGSEEIINWPYMKYFDEIFGNDKEFQRKFQIGDADTETEEDNSHQNVWYDTQTVFLSKYCFDCFSEFQDPTIPDSFLWHEVGRLLDKKPESCKEKIEELKENHLNDLLTETYDLSNRLPLQILLDNLIAKEIEVILEKDETSVNETWEMEKIDELVQFLYDNMELLKDNVSYYVLWAATAKKLRKSVLLCKSKWNELTDLYKTILNDKKENPDMLIDWRYISVFDVIFDYGMDMKLLEGYEKSKPNKLSKPSVNKLTFKDDEITEEEVGSEKLGFVKCTKKHVGDEKAFKLLEFYLKNKDKFSSSQQKKLALWEVIGKQIGVSGTECAHRFRNFKQVYTAYIQREVNRPEMPILWPYYSLCKKVFGYRAIKSKLKNVKTDADEVGDWSAKEIKMIINHFSTFYNEISENADNMTIWSALAQEMGRSATSIKDKFLELRKSYRKLRTMKTRNPDIKLTWKYFNLMDKIHKEAEEVQNREKVEMEVPSFDMIGKIELPDDDEYQCIIVMPEDEENIGNENIADNMLVPKTENEPRMFKWNKRSKTHLLRLYLKCLKRNVSSGNIWNEIALEMEDKTPKACKNMFAKLKNSHTYGSPYSGLLDKIFALQKVRTEMI